MTHAELILKARQSLNKKDRDSFVLQTHPHPIIAPQIHAKSKVLLFTNLLNCAELEGGTTFSQSALYLASNLKKNGYDAVFSDSKISLDSDRFVTSLERLQNILLRNPEINIICISLCEDFFPKAKKLISFLRTKTKAFIGVGGTMPTLTPEHVFAHLPDINFLVRGSGEEIIVKIAKILEGKNILSAFNKEEIERLARLEGFILKTRGLFIMASPDKINSIENFDNSLLDFSFLNKEDVRDGLTLYTSRGCLNNCFFCTTYGHGKYKAKSFQGLQRICRDYLAHLLRLHGNTIPESTRQISFYDDDFLADAARAIDFFDYIKSSFFRIKFFQTGIKSFFERRPSSKTFSLKNHLIDKIDKALLNADLGHIYIGTENFSDNELIRLGKGYSFFQIKSVIRELSSKKITQYHHLILSNHRTSIDEMSENIFKIACLQQQYKPYFNILAPPIPYLVSLYPSKSYKIAKLAQRLKYLNTTKVLSIRKHRQYDYPLVKNDIPMHPLSRRLVPFVEHLFKMTKDYTKILDNYLLELMLLQKKLPAYRKSIDGVLNKYIRYPELIGDATKIPVKNNRNNIQIMVTRRCHLRCSYCPIVKRDQDTNVKNIKGAIDLLFTSSKHDLRLDFTGGEPLLRFDLIKKAVSYARQMARRHSKNISFYMVSNLISLTDETADFLASERFFIELSLDGEQHFHNLYKVGFEKHLNPYEATTRQLGKIFSRNIAHCAIMVVSPKTVHGLCDNFFHLTRLGFKDIGINYAIGALWTEPLQRVFFEQLGLLKKKGKIYFEKGDLRLNNLGSRTEPAILNSEIMVDVDGQIRFLTDWLFEKDRKSEIPAQGKVGEARNLEDIFFSPAITLYRLLQYNRSPVIRDIIINNVEMGLSTKRYFATWKSISKKQ